MGQVRPPPETPPGPVDFSLLGLCLSLQAPPLPFKCCGKEQLEGRPRKLSILGWTTLPWTSCGQSSLQGLFADTDSYD